MIDEKTYLRLSPLGQRRARIMYIIDGFVKCGILYAAGYLACLGTYGLQVLFGVA